MQPCVRQKAFTHSRPDNGGVDWYYKGGLIVGLIWATVRVLGAYGESARELDINFLFGFLLTTGGWAAVFLVIDRVVKFLGWKRSAAVPDAAQAVEAIPNPRADLASPVPVDRPGAPARRSSRRPRR